MFNALYGAFLIYICFADFSLMSRAADYIGILELIYIPNLVLQLRPKIRYIVISALLVLYSYLVIVDMRESSNLLNDTSGMHYPIVMIWQSENVEAIMEGSFY